MDKRLIEIRTALMKGAAPAVRELVSACLDKGIPPDRILEEGMVSAMAIIGERFKRDEIYMPDVMIAARAMNAGLEVLEPALVQSGAKPRGKVLLASVRADLHDIGKNMVAMMFRGAGYSVVDLGVDVHEDLILEAIAEHEPDVVGLSSLLTTTLPNMKKTVETLEKADLRGRVIIMVGGAPVTPEFAEGIGADGYAPDSASAVERAAELLAARGQGLA